MMTGLREMIALEEELGEMRSVGSGVGLGEGRLVEGSD